MSAGKKGFVLGLVLGAAAYHMYQSRAKSG